LKRINDRQLKELQTPILAPNAENISAAGKALYKEELVAFPTETVYGLGGDATSEKAISRIFAIKNRPMINPLIVHVKDARQARDIVIFNELADKLTKAFWPGALTIVLPRSDDKISLLVSAGLNTLAVRAPNNRVAQSLLSNTGLAIAAPSANRSGGISPTEAEHVISSLPKKKGSDLNMILDGGPCQIGLESTVIDLSDDKPTLLRPGGISLEEIETVVGPLSIPANNNKGPQKSPGMLERHYAPDLAVRLEVIEPRPGEAFLAFGPSLHFANLNLSSNGNLSEAAANLFSMIRQVDGPPFKGIAVMPIPNHGLGRAINDRLNRAAKKSE
jgi:L-threonylcarbamoyladenylate synthase